MDKKRSGARPVRPGRAADVDLGGPALTPENIARSELGRFYWSGRQESQLSASQMSANAMREADRRKWRAALRARLESEAAEWARRRLKARLAARDREG